MPKRIDIHPHAINLLRSWYFRTREATFKTCYPPITTMWVKRGLAWQQIGVGFEQSRCTSPRQMMDWEEAGHQFGKLDHDCQGLMVGYWCHKWPAKDIGWHVGMTTKAVNAILWACSKRYESLCIDAGLVEVDANA